METMNGHVLWYEGGRLEELTNALLHLCVGSVADGILSNEINLVNLIRSGCVSGAHSLKVCDPLDGYSCKVSSSLSCCCPPLATASIQTSDVSWSGWGLVLVSDRGQSSHHSTSH